MVPTASLKVFQPLRAFSPKERDHWERYLIEGGAAARQRPLYAQRGDELGLLTPLEHEGADVRMVDGEYYVSPWRVRARVLHALLDLRESPVGEMAEMLVPEHEARKAARELSKMRRRDPLAVPFSQDSAWHVPIRWFLLVKDAERQILDNGLDRPSLRYVSTVSKARRRLDQAYAVVQRSELEPLLDLLRDLQGWLSVFDKHSLLELDYGSLCRFMTWDELDDDHSARDIHEAIDALALGEIGRSADLYQGLAGRWAEVRSHEALN